MKISGVETVEATDAAETPKEHDEERDHEAIAEAAWYHDFPIVHVVYDTFFDVSARTGENQRGL